MSRLPTVLGDDDAWGTVLNDYLTVGHNADGTHKAELNVLEGYGVAGDGTTDDTVALQACIDACISSSYAVTDLYLPPGEYKITAALVIPQSYGLRIRGAGKYITTISQATVAQSIFLFNGDNTHSTTISDMTVQYGSNASPIDSTNAGSVAFNYHVTGGTSAGFYYHQYENLHIKGAYRGFSLFETDGSQTLWDTTWKNVNFQHIKNRCVSMTSGAALGIPNLHFIATTITNTGSPTIVNTGEAFLFNGVNEAVFIGGDWEGWNDTLIYAYGGSYVTLSGVHVENHLFNAGTSKAFIASNATMTFDTCTISGACTANNTDYVVLFHLEAGGRIWVRGGWHLVSTALGNQYVCEVLHGTTSAGVVLGAKFEAFLNYTGASNLSDPGMWLGNTLSPGSTDQSATTGSFIYGGTRSLPYSTSIATDLALPSRYFKIAATNTTAFTITNPTGALVGDVFTYDIKNSSGGKMGTITWGNLFQLVAGPFINPPNADHRSITFYFDGTNYVEIGRVGNAGGFQENSLAPITDQYITAQGNVILSRRMVLASGVNINIASGGVLRIL